MVHASMQQGGRRRERPGGRDRRGGRRRRHMDDDPRRRRRVGHGSTSGQRHERASCSLGSPPFDKDDGTSRARQRRAGRGLPNDTGHGRERSPEGRFGARGTRADELMADVPWDDYYGNGQPARTVRRSTGARCSDSAPTSTRSPSSTTPNGWRRSTNKKRVRRHRVGDRATTAVRWSESSTRSTTRTASPTTKESKKTSSE